MAESIPLTDEQRRAAEGDEQALNELMAKTASSLCPTTASREARRTSLSVES